jgi:hypothetical protein
MREILTAAVGWDILQLEVECSSDPFQSNIVVCNEIFKDLKSAPASKFINVPTPP